MMLEQALKERLIRFCDLLDEQAELQETLVAVCLAQLQAGIEANILKLNEKTSAINFLTNEISKLDKRVRSEIHTIVSTLGYGREDRKLSDAVNLLPEPWRTRARESLDRIKISILYLKQWSSEALPFYKNALKSRQELLKAISPESVRVAPGYSITGAVVDKNPQAKFMDNRG